MARFEDLEAGVGVGGLTNGLATAVQVEWRGNATGARRARRLGGRFTASSVYGWGLAGTSHGVVRANDPPCTGSA